MTYPDAFITVLAHVEYADGSEKGVAATLDEHRVWRYADNLEVIDGTILWWEDIENE